MKTMSNSYKMCSEIVNYVVKRKRRNSDLSCRVLAEEVSNKFQLKVSKSSINEILKSARLSSPVGRRVSQSFQASKELNGTGYCLLLGVNYLLGLSGILASCIKRAIPSFPLKTEKLEAISEAWILSKAIYNVPLERIENYSKNELWFLLGRRVSKGLLKQYIEIFKSLQLINFQIVKEIKAILQDIHFLRVKMADGTQYFLDGQLKSVWREQKIPIDFCTTIDIANSYINNSFNGSEPLIIFNARPESLLGEEISDFIFSMDDSSASKRMSEIELISPEGSVVKRIPCVAERRTFIIGVWPWQYKAILELEKRMASSRFCLEALGPELHIIEDQVKFVQHVYNNEVMLRLIVLKSAKDGPAKLAILTNLDKKEWETPKILGNYLKHFQNFEAGHKLFLEAVKSPCYLEEFLSSGKILNEVKKLNDCNEPDRFFSILVELLNNFAKRSFFPSLCSGWSLLKMRELFYKQSGLIQRDLSEDILFNLFDSNRLETKDYINFIAAKFNEAPIYDFSGRKLWIVTP